jgi:hypothetical protein
MQRPTKILIGGATVAVLVAVAGVANTVHLESKIHELEATCIEEGKHGLAKYPRVQLLCDAKDLVRLETDSNPSTGVQAQIVSAQRADQDSRGWPYALAAVIIFLSALPWTWYFLLRRIRELRDAILGKGNA